MRCVTPHSSIYHSCGFDWAGSTATFICQGYDLSAQGSKKQWGITKLYNAYFHEPTSQLYKLHAKLDALVLQAYGFKPDDDLLKKLLTLNLELAEEETRGGAIVGPWAPTQQTQ